MTGRCRYPDSAIQAALSEDSRPNIVAVPGGYQMLLSFRELYGTLPLIRVADPDSSAEVGRADVVGAADLVPGVVRVAVLLAGDAAGIEPGPDVGDELGVHALPGGHEAHLGGDGPGLGEAQLGGRATGRRGRGAGEGLRVEAPHAEDRPLERLHDDRHRIEEHPAAVRLRHLRERIEHRRQQVKSEPDLPAFRLEFLGSR